ncbi:hypothetical protein Tco_0483948 [Tanacetum coccineum]
MINHSIFTLQIIIKNTIFHIADDLRLIHHGSVFPTSIRRLPSVHSPPSAVVDLKVIENQLTEQKLKETQVMVDVLVDPNAEENFIAALDTKTHYCYSTVPRRDFVDESCVGAMSLNEQSFSELLQVLNLSLWERLNHSVRRHSVNEVPKPKKNVMGLVRSPQLLEDPEDKSLKNGRDKFEWIRSNDIIEPVISYEITKATWTDLVHSFEGPSNTKENKIMDLKLEYNTFRAKSFESLSHTYTRYKTLLNKLSNDGVTLSKHEINIFKKIIDDEVDVRTSEEYLRDLDIEFYERALLAGSKRFIERRNNFSSQKANENTECYKCGSSSTESPKPFQSKNKGFEAKTFDWDEEEVSDDEEMTQVEVLMALTDDELVVGKNHARNGEWIDITMRKVNILLSMDEDSDWQNYLKYINIDIKFVEEQRLNLLSKYNKLVFELNKCKDDLLIFKQAKLEVERHNLDIKLLDFNTGRILVSKSQVVNECLKLTEAPSDPEPSKESGSEPLTPLPPLKNIQKASLSSEVMPLTYQDRSPRERPGLGTMKHTKPKAQESSSKSISGRVTIYDIEPVTSSVPTEVKNNEQESKIDELTKLVQMLMDEKINST